VRENRRKRDRGEIIIRKESACASARGGGDAGSFVASKKKKHFLERDPTQSRNKRARDHPRLLRGTKKFLEARGRKESRHRGQEKGQPFGLENLLRSQSEKGEGESTAREGSRQ